MHKIEQFVKALNERFTLKDINGVATVQPMGSHSWMIVCSFDTHVEYYQIDKHPLADEWQFMRFYPEARNEH